MQLVPYKQSYETMNELLDRIGYLRYEIDRACFDNTSKALVNDNKTELLDREIELIEFVAQLDQNEDEGYPIFRLVNFGIVTPNIARELYEKYHVRT